MKSIFILTMAVGLMSGCQENTNPETNRQLYPANSENIARANLNDQIKLFEGRIDTADDRSRKARDIEALLGLYQAEIRYYGRVSRLTQMKSLTEAFLAEEPNFWRAHLLVADAYSSLHLFAKAIEHIAKAKELGAPTNRADKALQVQWHATGENFEQVLAAREKAAQINPSLTNLGLLAGIQGDLGLYDEAEASYQLALENYNSVSPFAFAWIYFQRGLLWGEKAIDADMELAKESYDLATTYLPNYSQASVHYAEVLLEDGLTGVAIDTLEVSLNVEDPEGKGFKGEILAEDDPALSTELIAKADQDYRALLSKNELAFADHATEFYMGPGNDAAYAEELALKNLNSRKTKRAFSQALEATDNNGSKDKYCVVLTQIEERLPKHSYLQSLYDEHQGNCP